MKKKDPLRAETSSIENKLFKPVLKEEYSILGIYLSTYLPPYLSISPSTYLLLSVCLTVYLPTNLPTYLPTYLSPSLFIQPRFLENALPLSYIHTSIVIYVYVFIYYYYYMYASCGPVCHSTCVQGLNSGSLVSYGTVFLHPPPTLPISPALVCLIFETWLHYVAQPGLESAL